MGTSGNIGDGVQRKSVANQKELTFQRSKSRLPKTLLLPQEGLSDKLPIPVIGCNLLYPATILEKNLIKNKNFTERSRILHQITMHYSPDKQTLKISHHTFELRTNSDLSFFKFQI